jgi:hypothetical protein
LNFAFKFADFKRYYFFDWNELEDEDVKLTLASDEEVQNSAYYPEPGFFARDHSHPVSHTIDQAKQTFAIDGKWEASDFSRFYSKIADIYAFLYVVSQIRGKKLSQVDEGYIKHSIGGYFWKGGGSYVGFYDDIFNRVELYNPLDVARITYASPGVIELEGKKEVFADIKALLQTFDGNFLEAREQYKNIRANLKGANLLGAHGKVRLGKRLSDNLKVKTDRLALSMNVSDPDEILDLCNENVLVYCKVILSLFRRARDLFLFHAEGRVTVSELTEHIETDVI